MKCTCGKLTTLNVVHRTDGPCYIPEPQRQWIGLNDSEIGHVTKSFDARLSVRLGISRAIEAKLKGKNT